MSTLPPSLNPFYPYVSPTTVPSMYIDSNPSTFFCPILMRKLQCLNNFFNRKITFSTKYCERNVCGNCSDWRSFIAATLPIPNVQYYYASVTLTSRYYNATNDQVVTRTGHCSQASYVSDIVQAIQRQSQMGKSIDAQINCGGYSWNVYVCSGEVVVCIGCSTHCASINMSLYAIVDPCVNAERSLSSYSALEVSVAQIAYYLDIAVIAIIPDSVSALIFVNSSQSLRVYALAAPVNTVVSSTQVIKQSGWYALISPTQQGTSVTIKNLSPSSKYNLYVYTEDLEGHVMDINTVLKSTQEFSTLCCIGIKLISSYPVVRSYPNATLQTQADPFLFTLDFSPDRLYRVNISVYPVHCALSSTQNITYSAYAQPSSFVYNSGDAFLYRSFILRGSPGCYSVVLHSGNDLMLTNATSSVRILGSTSSTPALESAVFSNDGYKIYLSFDMDTNYGGISLEFKCSALFLFTSAEYCTCKWYSPRIVLVVLSLREPSVAVGDMIRLKGGLVEPMHVITLIDNLGVVIQPPLNPTIPVAALSVPSVASPCTGLVLDPTSSSGSGARPWSQVRWFVNSTGVCTPSAMNIESYLNAHANKTSYVVTVPSTYLQPNCTLIVTLLATNILGAHAATSKAVFISPSSRLVSVSIEGSSQISMVRSQVLRLNAIASVVTCGNSSSAAILTYTWKLYNKARYLPSMISISKNPRSFELPAYSLESLSQYIAQVTVSDSVESSNSEFVIINVGAAGVVSSIKGGFSRDVGSNNTIVIDASDSRDLDYPLQLNAVNFSWNCFVTYPTYGASCGVKLPSQPILSFPPHSLRSSRTYNFTVLVTGAYGSSSLSSVSIRVFDNTAPSVLLGPVNALQNPDVRTIIRAMVNSTWPCITSWSCSNCNFNLSEAATTPKDMRFDHGDMLPVDLVIRESFLISGLTYAFTLSVSRWPVTGSTLAAISTIQIFMNSAPMGGAIKVSPVIGNALLTLFSMVTYDWYDDATDYPLQYVFSYYSYDPTIANTVKSLSQLTYVTSYLGQGLLKMKYKVTCVATAYDIYNSSSIATTTAIVYPPQNLSAVLNQVLGQKLDGAASAYDTDLTTAIVGAVAVTLNTANCTLVPDCNALNRSQCSSVMHTCGPCVEGYLGIAGPSNAPCKLPHVVVSIGGGCSMDSDCISNRCMSGTCKVSPKQCPGNCTGFTHGVCKYRNSNGQRISFCDANSFFCQAQCSCLLGWYGADCSLNKDAYANLQSTKELLSMSYAAAVTVQVGLILASSYSIKLSFNLFSM